MIDKINRPPLQCTVLRSGDSVPLPQNSPTYVVAGPNQGIKDETVSAAIRAYIEKVSKIRIFDEPEREQSDQ